MSSQLTRHDSSIGLTDSDSDSIYEGLNNHTPESPRSPTPEFVGRNVRTFRIGGLPPTTTKLGFRADIVRMMPDLEAEADVVVSVAEQIATVTIIGVVPAELDTCQLGRKLCDVTIGAATGLVVDCDFDGMTPLYAGEDPLVDIIAVAGLGGHGFGSWEAQMSRCTTPGYMWLRDRYHFNTPENSVGVRVFTYGYDSLPAEESDTVRLEGQARKFLDHVDAVRGAETDKNRAIVFLGHGYGGLIIKQAIASTATNSTSSPQDQAIMHSSIGILFLAVPHLGMDHHCILHMTKGKTYPHLIEELSVNSPLLQRLNYDFMTSFKQKYEVNFIASYFEGYNTIFVDSETGEEKHQLLVSKKSALGASTGYGQDEIACRDHYSMIQKRYARDQFLTGINLRYHLYVEAAPMTIIARWENLGLGETSAYPPPPVPTKVPDWYLGRPAYYYPPPVVRRVDSGFCESYEDVPTQVPV